MTAPARRRRLFRPASVGELIAYAPSRHPFQIWTLALLALSGIARLLSPEGDSAIDQVLDGPFRIAWAVLLLGGGALGLVAAFWPDRALGLLLERISLIAIAAATAVYGTLVLVTFGILALPAGGLSLGVAAASAVRIRQIGPQLERLRRWLDETHLA